MSNRPNQEHSRTMPYALTGAAVALGTALIATALSSHSAPQVPEKKAPVVQSVADFKKHLGDMGITFKQVPVTPGATAYDLVRTTNIEEGEKVKNAEGQLTTVNIVSLGEVALQRLAQLPAGEGNGQFSELGPDGVQEHDLIAAAPGQDPVMVDVPVILTQSTANIINNGGPLTVVE